MKKIWYGVGAKATTFIIGNGSEDARIRAMGFMFALSAVLFLFSALVVSASPAFAVTDLNGAASNLQTGFQSFGRALYYGIGAVGLATGAGGMLHMKNAHKTGQSIAPGATATAIGAGLTGIGTYLAMFNQTAAQDTGGMSTNGMGVPQ